MKYYMITENGSTALTKEEYDRILAELNEKSALASQLESGEITIDSVPTEWRDDVLRKVEGRKAREAARDLEEISEEEFGDMVSSII